VGIDACDRGPALCERLLSATGPADARNQVDCALTPEQLIDLFKHWDTRVSHMETLYLAFALAPLGLLAAQGFTADKRLVLLLATASVTSYIYHLLLIRRLAVFQDNIFGCLQATFGNSWNRVVDDPKGRVGVRRLRVLGVIVLTILWLPAYLIELGGAHSATRFTNTLAGALLLSTVFVAVCLWLDTPENN